MVYTRQLPSVKTVVICITTVLVHKLFKSPTTSLTLVRNSTLFSLKQSTNPTSVEERAGLLDQCGVRGFFWFLFLYFYCGYHRSTNCGFPACILVCMTPLLTLSSIIHSFIIYASFTFINIDIVAVCSVFYEVYNYCIGFCPASLLTVRSWTA